MGQKNGSPEITDSNARKSKRQQKIRHNKQGKAKHCKGNLSSKEDGDLTKMLRLQMQVCRRVHHSNQCQVYGKTFDECGRWNHS